MKKTVPLALATLALGFASCEGDDPTPQPEPVDNPPTTETVASVQNEVNLVIENRNNDPDGDSTETEITVTNKRGEEVFAKTYETKEIHEVLKNLPEDTYVISTKTMAAGKRANDKDEVSIEPPTPEVSYNLEVNKENVKDGMPAGTEVATVNLEVEIDGQAQTVEELKAKGYVVIVTVDNKKQLKVVGDEKIVLVEGLDRDGEDGSDPEELKKLKGKVNVKVLKKDEDGNAVVVFENETDLDVEVEDVDDYTPTFEGKKLTIDEKPIVVEKDGKLAKDYVDGKESFNPKEVISMGTGAIKNVIEGGERLFKAHLFDDGFTYPQFKDGPHKGQFVDVSRALEPLYCAMSTVRARNYPKLGPEKYRESMQKLIGLLLSKLPAEAWEVVYTNPDTGEVFMAPKEMDKIAGLGAFRALKKYNPKDWQ